MIREGRVEKVSEEGEFQRGASRCGRDLMRKEKMVEGRGDSEVECAC